jgi:hypothetical protein
MAPTRIDWPSALTPGVRFVPVLLVAGVPRVLVPAGVAPTTVAASSGSLSGLWWPGTGSLTQSLPGGVTFDPVRGWLDPFEVFEVYEEAKLLEGDVRVEALTLSLVDPDGAATADLSIREARTSQFLGSEIDAADTTIPLASANGFASSGIATVGRETLIYNSISGTSLLITGAPGARGRYGSVARAHRAPTHHRPLVTAAGARHWQGRMASLWVARLSDDGTTLTDPTLVYLGVIGAGVQLTRRGMRWSLPIDHASEALTRKIEKRTVSLFGYEHHGLGIDSPLLITWNTDYALDARSADPHNGGWHADRETFVTAFGRYLTDSSASVRTTHRPDGRLAVNFYGGSGRQFAGIVAPWNEPTFASLEVDTDGSWVSASSMPEACFHLDGRVHLGDALDQAKVPSTLAWTVSTPAAGEARLAISADTLRSKALFARVLSNSSGTLLCDAILPADTTVTDRERLTLCTKRTTATLGLVARGDTALGALRAIGEALEELQGLDLHDVAVDWDGIAAVLSTIPLAGISPRREYKLVGGDSLLGLLVEELKLRGCALVVRNGLLSAARSMDFASTEPQVATITKADVITDPEGNPLDVEVQDNTEPLATAMSFELADGSVFTFVDVTRQDEFGDGAEIKCTALRHLPVGESIPAVVTSLGTVAQALLGPRSEPWRLVRVPLPATFLHLNPGDVVSFTHDEVPTWRGTRGVTDAPCQVVDARREVFGGKARAMVGLRLQAGTYYGYAPAAMVAAGGISGDELTFDVTTPWGANGFCSPFDSAGAAVTDPLDGLSVDDEVQLVEVDAESPATPEAFSIVSIDRATHKVVLSGSPSATFVALAASALKVMLKFVAYGPAAVSQRAYAYIADHTSGDLGSGGEPDRWAA